MNRVDTIKKNRWLAVLTVVFFLGIMMSLDVALGGFTVRALQETPTPGGTATVAVQPSMLLSPVTGAPGTSVAIVSSGWEPETTVLVRLGDPQTGQLESAAVLIATADAHGEVNASFVFPVDGRWATLPSVLVVLQATSGSAATSVPFAVVTDCPTVTATATTGTTLEATATMT
jgi:hypothetical protein